MRSGVFESARRTQIRFTEPGWQVFVLESLCLDDRALLLVLHSTTTGALGNATGTSYYGYSPQDKTYTYDAFNSLGQAEHAKGTLEGNTWVWIDTEDFLGQVVKGRYTVTVTSPTSYTFKFEVAPLGGGDYATVAEGKGTKLK